MSGAAIPTVDEYWRGLEPRLWRLSQQEQLVCVALYRELARGTPVDAARLGRATGVSTEEAEAQLRRDAIKRLVLADQEGRVAGFGGLATMPMHHRFEVASRVLWTWCAWDSLFIPAILGETARVTSADPESGDLVRLVVGPGRIESAAPADAMVSFLLPEADLFSSSAANVMAGFCHYVYFFASRRTGERWTTQHPGTFLFPLDAAFTLGKRLNARSFGV